MPELPRITRSLRRFTNLDRPKNMVDLNPNDLLRKQREKANRLHSENYWQSLCKSISKEAQLYFTKLCEIVTKLLKDCTLELQHEFILFSIHLLLDADYMSQKKFHTLKEQVGHITFEDANKMFINIKAIQNNCNKDIIKLLRRQKENIPEIAEPDLFESKCVYNSARVLWPQTENLRSMSSENGIQNSNNFTMKYKESIEKLSKNEFDKATFIEGLKACHSKNSLAMSLQEFRNFINNKIKNSNNLQVDLFDLLGSENIEFIQYLVQHDKEILSLSSTAQSQKKQVTSSTQGPVISGQVTIQSEKEKQLQKQIRKGEKKLNKISNKKEGKGDTEMNENSNLYLMKQEVLRERRTPIFQSVTQEREQFPFVFDSNTAGRCTSGYISGQKIMLPENVIRKDTPTAEEVHIPVPENQPINVDYKPIEISTLDKIGQLAFKGTKTLNRIQSIVFNTAYNTNANLLICAPTGAGKTNVAMLTVVHQLKQHIEHGELMKDQFKIVYITPMKALAAEMTANFGKRLAPLGISVKELTGDMQLTKTEIQQTQMIVTTPEKWDVLTRKGAGDISLISIVKLLIVDEVHLLHGDRGPVVEALVARTLRQVESSQSMIRIVGLSATLPNYIDVARFLRVNPTVGLFYFDHRFRPVPLSQTFIGVKATASMQQMNHMDRICYDKVIEQLRQGYQVMVFVHTRNGTVRVANVLKELANQNDTLKLFLPANKDHFSNKAFAKSKSKHLVDLFANGLSVHHAGLLRSERNLVEKYFAEGLIKVLVCTSTLAWGVNLPAHAVIIRGTDIYDSQHGSFVDLNILDVLQIFGRAGRPQFDISGHAVIITTHNKLNHYLSLLTNQIPIESNFIKYLADNLNAEIALGTISNIEEAIQWLSYTYLFVRMRLNHQVYGISHETMAEDQQLEQWRRNLIDISAKALDQAKMIRYNITTGDLSITDLGRIASHFYLKCDTVEVFNELMKPIMTESEILAMISKSQEFEQLKVREDEMKELNELHANYCELPAEGGVENIHGKVNILLQTYLSHGSVNSFSLISDQAYITQNAVRICRALFKIMLRKNNAIMAGRLLEMSKMMEAQLWNFSSPLRQFTCLSPAIIDKLENYEFTIDKLKDMSVNEIGDILRNQASAGLVKKCCEELPMLEMESNLQPITRTVLRIRLKIYPQFKWNDKIHGKGSVPFWIWIEDPDSNFLYHHEYFTLTKKAVCQKLEQELVITIPLQEPLPSQYIVKVTSDYWLGCENTLPITFHDLILPEEYPPHTDLLELQPLSARALKEPQFEKLFKFPHFNAIQTQIFYCLYHTDNNVLLGAPTGSGKTIAAEIAMFRVFKNFPTEKVVYIAPLKALVRERMKDWKIRLEERLGKRVVELTGDVSPDTRVIAGANVIVTTPEKWDGISRSWQTRNYVKNVALIIIDEIHLLGEDRGPVLEVIVSRINFISSHRDKKTRVVGLSTALANALDLGNWLGIKNMGLYNFRPSVRPVPLEIHINGFPGKFYCPRMATMNRPTFQAIRQHAPVSPSLIFVSSRRQTRLTALDLVAYLAAEDDPKQWLHMPEEEMNNILDQVRDTNLKLTLAFGIGLHHAGLQEKDRTIVEELFVNNRIQVLIATATLAWGVNFPAHLVVIKGTEYYDGKSKRYVDMPVTDILQMMGRAGRPQFDDSGVAVILVHDLKKDFYKTFLHQPFPVESSLLGVLADHINAEIAAGTIKNKQEFLDYLTWTYFFRRLIKNPKYYGLNELEPQSINSYLSKLVDDTIHVLMDSHCIDFDEEEQILYSLSMGKIASFYYLSHQTMLIFEQSLRESLTIPQYLRILCNAREYNELPVRHNEELLNEELSKICPCAIDDHSYDSPNTKAFLLLQAHFSRLPLPCTDYKNDLKSILDQAIRIIQAMIDTVAEYGWLESALKIIILLQMIIQARWYHEAAITTLPHVNSEHIPLFLDLSIILPMLCSLTSNNYELLANKFSKEFTEEQIYQIYQTIRELPIISVDLNVQHLEGKARTMLLKPDASNQISVCRNADCILNIRLQRKNKSKNLKAYCPMFQKGKDEGWFLVLGNIYDRELLALKRVSGVNDQARTYYLEFSAPDKLGLYALTFYLMSDCYLGLDQQYNIEIYVTD